MTYTTKWLRLEGLAVLVAAVGAFAHVDASWWLFAALILAPDIGMLGYLAGPRLGAAATWAAHIGVDRALGYGLKEPDAFKHTHLGWIGGRPD